MKKNRRCTMDEGKRVSEVRIYSGGKNITESLEKALSDWVKLEKLKELNTKLATNPLKLQKNLSEIRKINRKR